MGRFGRGAKIGSAKTDPNQLGPAKTYILRGTRGPMQLKPGL